MCQFDDVIGDYSSIVSYYIIDTFRIFLACTARQFFEQKHSILGIYTFAIMSPRLLIPAPNSNSTVEPGYSRIWLVYQI